MFPYQRLRIWTRSAALAADILRLTRHIRDRRTDIILDQLWRSASSISANIAEGAAQDSHAQFARYLAMALGSASETESYLTLAAQAGLLPGESARQLLGEVAELKSMIWVFQDRVRRDPRRRPVRRRAI